MPKDPLADIVETPALPETFVDSVGMSGTMEYTARLDLCVERTDRHGTMRRFPVARLILTPRATVQLMETARQLVAQLEAEGALKRLAPGTKTEH